jgi:hypothetical protein
MAKTAKPKLVTEVPELDDTYTADIGDAAVTLTEAPLSIAKPSGSPLDRFKSKRPVTISGVKTLLTALPIMKISEADDFVRTHPDMDNYWSSRTNPFHFVDVPVKGSSDTLHLVDGEIALLLPPKKIKRWALALASKPYDVFFLCTVPTVNPDDVWNASNIVCCEHAREKWTMAVSRRLEGADGYRPEYTDDLDAFPEPNWPTQSLEEIITVTFQGRMITSVDHPGFRRLRGLKQSVK